ncbi:MAG: hypothetical protein HQK52_01765 [Oligoflexia bacterium]|nr:hypothetical protein [Oligoflexia bacterium]
MSDFRKIFKFFVQFLSFPLPAFIKIPLWRCIGLNIGKHVHIGPCSFIMVENLTLEDYSQIDPFTFIVFLKSFTLGKRSRIAYFTKIYGYGTFIAHARCLVSVQSLIECSHNCKVTMEDYSCFGPRNTIYTHGIYLPLVRGFPQKMGNVLIGQYSWTGMCTTILPRTTIGENTIVAPGATLTGHVPSFRFIRPNSYHYEEVPIESKKNNYSPEQIQTYISNTIYFAIHGRPPLVDTSDFFKKHFTEIPTDYKKSKIIIWTEGDASVDSKELSLLTPQTIIAGYDIPRFIQASSNLSWIDYSTFLAHSNNNSDTYDLVEYLCKNFSLKFLYL